MTQQTIPLNRLRFGHEHEPPLNARKVGRETDVDSLKASIKAHGLGQALNIHEDDQGIFVVDGNRRLAALVALHADGDLPEDYGVRCDTGETSVDSDELSLALNFERVPMHEADTFEKFRELNDRGLSPDQIASRFGVDIKRVRKFLALGRLHPDVLDAWRNDQLVDRFGRGTVEILHALTLAPSVEAQGEVFNRLRKEERLSGYAVRSEFGAEDRETSRAMRLIGIDAYVASGGSVTEDLFGDNHVIDDPALAVRLANEKLQAEAKRLRGEGWSWAKLESELPDSWSWTWGRSEPEYELAPEQTERLEKLRADFDKLDPDNNDEDYDASVRIENEIDEIEDHATPVWSDEIKSAAGCVLKQDHNGDLQITYGVKEPKASKASASSAKDGEKPKPKEQALSNALCHRLSVQMTQAAQDSIPASPHVALAGLLASVACGVSYGVPVRVEFDGMGSRAVREVTGFDKAFETLLAKTDKQLMQDLADAFKAAITLEGEYFDKSETNAAFLSALDGKVLSERLTERFDAEDYFKAAPMAFTVQAIEEAINKDEARKAAKLKKGELIKFALENVPKTGWLPKELRTVHYTGPGAAKPKGRKKAA